MTLVGEMDPINGPWKKKALFGFDVKSVFLFSLRFARPLRG